MNETPPGGGPTVLRMILGRQLQALREKAGMTYEQAAEAIYSSPYTVRRMERAEGGLKPLTVKSLLMAYGITDVREIDAFLALARDASKPGWWHSYNDVLPVLVPHLRRPGGSRQPRSAATTRTGYPACCRPRTTPAPASGPDSPTPPTRKSTAGRAAAGPPAHPDPARPAAAVAGHRRDRAAPPGRDHRRAGDARPDRHA